MSSKEIQVRQNQELQLKIMIRLRVLKIGIHFQKSMRDLRLSLNVSE